MGCNCGKKNSEIEYSVRFKDGTSKVFDTTTEAQAAIRKARGGQMRAVKKQPA